METNICDINHLNGDVLLPPRKRLLAGLKKQNLECPPRQISTPSTSSELDTQLNNTLSSHLNNPSLSPEEIAESSRTKAIDAAKVAKAARALADEKAAFAAKAVAAAKSALELTASVSEEASSDDDSYSTKNKLKKHTPTHHSYVNEKHHLIGNCKTDEELARKLHRDMNSSPRITKNGSSSNWKNYKHKKQKLSPPVAEKSYSKYNGNAESSEVNSKVYTVKVNENPSKFCKSLQIHTSNGEAGSSYVREESREVAVDETSPNGRKRGRIKLKRLPLSFCTFRDQESPVEVNRSSTPHEATRGKSTTCNNISLTPADDGSKWKCQDFKAPQCIKQNKVMQS